MQLPITGQITSIGTGSYQIEASVSFEALDAASGSFTPVATFMTTGDIIITLGLFILIVVEVFTLVFRRYA